MSEQAYLYQEIAESLRRRIASGELNAGVRLPSVRALANQWGCTPGTIGRAYQMLAEEGLVVSHTGRGTVVAPGPLQQAEGAWPWAALVHRAEQYLLEVMAGGNTPAEATAALGVAMGRWQELQQRYEAEQRSQPLGLLRFAGSHDLALDVLATLLGQAAPALRWQADYTGSLGGLMALARGEAEMAGSHLWDEQSDSYTLPFVRRLFPGRRVGLVTLARRDLGLIVARDNPRSLREVPDLGQPGLSLVNRQAGSGTRVWLDAQLAQAGLAGEQINGYEWEVTTHTAIAQAVAGGKADVGVGIYAAAQAYELDFVPLTQEQYDLVMLAAGWRTPAGEAVRQVLQKQDFHDALGALGGYDTAVSGQELWV